MQPQSDGPIDYKTLILRLTAHACRFLGFVQSAENERVIQGTGKSPEDFAIHIVEQYATGEISYGGVDSGFDRCNGARHSRRFGPVGA